MISIHARLGPELDILNLHKTQLKMTKLFNYLKCWHMTKANLFVDVKKYLMHEIISFKCKHFVFRAD